MDDKTGWVGMTFNCPMPFGEDQPGIEIGMPRERPLHHCKDKNDNSRGEISIALDGMPSLTVYDAKGKSARRSPSAAAPVSGGCLVSTLVTRFSGA